MKALLAVLMLTTCTAASDCPADWCQDQRGPSEPAEGPAPAE